MMLIRPIALHDLDALLALAQLTGFGLTTLPRDRAFLQRRIRESIHGFSKVAGDPPRGETFLFVLEDLHTGKLVGTSGIVTKVGGFEPFYAYRIETALHESKTLGIRKEIPTLHLVTEHDGPCEIGSLFLDPAYRRGGNGRLLSLVRFLFMAEFPDHFDPMVIAEMRGVIDERGHSPFWDALGKHFFEIDFPKADALSMTNKRFIADLMPKHPIYLPLLPQPAQEVVGHVHEQTAPALKILQREGFEFCGMVDIFEGGPIVRCPRDNIRTVRESIRCSIGAIEDALLEAQPHIIARVVGEFRAVLGPLELQPDGTARIASATALALGVRIGDPLRVVAMQAPSTSSRQQNADSASAR